MQARPVQGQPHRARSPPICSLVHQVSYCFFLPPWFRGGALRGGACAHAGFFFGPSRPLASCTLANFRLAMSGFLHPLACYAASGCVFRAFPLSCYPFARFRRFCAVCGLQDEGRSFHEPL